MHVFYGKILLPKFSYIYFNVFFVKNKKIKNRVRGGGGVWNHLTDWRNCLIIYRGSSGWGSRPSSSASNPWGSSALSPNTDGSASSPSHLSGRPSSGGSGSRPSTAGSERTHERSSNAWGVSSRPSSASGISSNQTSLRPHSAETRPNSSQLSRFAEPVSEVVSRGPVGTAERRVSFNFYECLSMNILVLFFLLIVSRYCALLLNNSGKHYWLSCNSFPCFWVWENCIAALFCSFDMQVVIDFL